MSDTYTILTTADQWDRSGDDADFCLPAGTVLSGATDEGEYFIVEHDGHTFPVMKGDCEATRFSVGDEVFRVYEGAGVREAARGTVAAVFRMYRVLVVRVDLDNGTLVVYDQTGRCVTNDEVLLITAAEYAAGDPSA